MNSNSWGDLALYLLVGFVILFGWARYEFLTSTDLASGFFEPGAGWLGWIGWAFRSVGLVIGLLIVLILPIWGSKARRYDDESYFKALSISNSEPPSDLPAAAVSVLEDRKVTVRTVRTILFEMCQSGVLRITFEVKGSRYGSRREREYGRERELDVKWSLGSRSKLDWENTVYESMKRNELDPDSDQFKKTVGRQLGEYLQNRGLFDGNPMSVARWVYMLWDMGTALFAAALIGWMAVADIHWFFRNRNHSLPYSHFYHRFMVVGRERHAIEQDRAHRRRVAGDKSMDGLQETLETNGAVCEGRGTADAVRVLLLRKCSS